MKVVREGVPVVNAELEQLERRLGERLDKAIEAIVALKAMVAGVSTVEPQAYSLAEVATKLRMSQRTVRRLIQTGQLKMKQIGRLKRIPSKSLEEFMDADAVAETRPSRTGSKVSMVGTQRRLRSNKEEVAAMYEMLKRKR